jgi:outer membrane receptor protein involved in Fe transport
MKSIFLIVFTLSFSQVFSQNASIKGKVLDKNTLNPIEYATVTLLTIDSTIVKRIVTNKDGSFFLKWPNSNNAILEIQFIGYTKFDSLLIKNEVENNFKLPQIFLTPQLSSLKEVTVVGKKNISTVQLNKQIINVKQFSNAANGTGLDIIKNLASVTVNTEGNILLRGSSDFQVLINGKYSTRSPAEILAQLPANAIENIEMITTPSAIYDAEGKSGIINIITKKNALQGWSIAGNGMFGGYNPLIWSSDVSIGYATPKWNSFLSADFRQYNIDGYRIGEVRTIRHDTVSWLPSDGIRPLKDKQYGIRVGTSYLPNKTSSITIAAYYGYKQNDRSANLHYKDFIKIGAPLDLNNENGAIINNTFYNQNLFVRTGEFFTINSDFTQVFVNKTKLSVSVVYEYSVLGGPLRNQNNDEFTSALTLKERSDERSPLNAWRLQTDYTIPLKNKNKIDIGYQLKYVHHQGNFSFDSLNISTGVWGKNLTFNDTLDLKQTIHAAYLQYSGQKKVFSYNMGLRAEYMNRDFTHALGTSPYKVEQLNIFPSIQGLWTLPNNQKLRIGYSKRIDRPTTRLMSPFKNHRHSEFIEVGDPTLLPEITNVLEISYTKNWQDINFTTTAYYNKVTDKIFRVNDVYDRITLLRTFTNAGNSTSIGMEFLADIKASSWIRFNVSGNLYNYKVTGIVKGIDVSQNSFNHNFNGNVSLDFTKKFKFQLDGNYISKTVTAQGEDGELFLANTGIRYLFSNSFSTGLLLQNIFNSNHQTIMNKGNDFYVSTNYIKYDMVFQLSISYRINDNGKKTKTLKTEYGEKDF